MVHQASTTDIPLHPVAKAIRVVLNRMGYYGKLLANYSPYLMLGLSLLMIAVPVYQFTKALLKGELKWAHAKENIQHAWQSFKQKIKNTGQAFWDMPFYKKVLLFVGIAAMVAAAVYAAPLMIAAINFGIANPWKLKDYVPLTPGVVHSALATFHGMKAYLAAKRKDGAKWWSVAFHGLMCAVSFLFFMAMHWGIYHGPKRLHHIVVGLALTLLKSSAFKVLGTFIILDSLSYIPYPGNSSGSEDDIMNAIGANKALIGGAIGVGMGLSAITSLFKKRKNSDEPQAVKTTSEADVEEGGVIRPVREYMNKT